MCVWICMDGYDEHDVVSAERVECKRSSKSVDYGVSILYGFLWALLWCP